jgi:DNA-directed RNA polymerase subunit M
MHFCKKCGSLMVAKKTGKETLLVCRKCKTKMKGKEVFQIREEIVKKPMDDVVIVDKQKDALPKIKSVCPKCGHTEAVWWLHQTRSMDEPPTTFFRCVKCKHSWREY